MKQLQRIIVGYDFRAGGAHAVQSAVAFAHRYGAMLRLVHVVEPLHFYQRLSHPLTPPFSLEEIAQRAGAGLEELVSSPQLAPFHVEYEVRTGKPFVELILARRAWQADLIIVGGSADGEEPVLGRTSERVVRKALVPVLVAKRPFSSEAKTFLVPTDFSLGAHKAAEEALALAASFGGRVCFLHAIDLPYMPGVMAGADMPAFSPAPLPVAEDLEAEWQAFVAELPGLNSVAWQRHTVSDVAAQAIIQQAQQQQADVIVMGTHGRSGLAHMLLGSVTEDVVRAVDCPVLTIRPEAFEFELP